MSNHEAGFTPGPWTFDGEPDNHIVWSSDDDRVCFMASAGPTTANAHLIATAPDLYKELEAVVREFGDSKYPEWREAIAALAKARGQS